MVSLQKHFGMPKTGEICQKSGIYNFARHVDGTIGCHPRSEELVIEVSEGQVFPPMKTCRKGSIWIYVGKELEYENI